MGLKLGQETVFITNRKTKHIANSLVLEHLGVRWNALLGSLLRGNFIDGDCYVYVEGPFCPQCNVELITRTESKWKGLSVKHVWRCPKCDIRFERPNNHLDEEEEIERRAKKKIA